MFGVEEGSGDVLTAGSQYCDYCWKTIDCTLPCQAAMPAQLVQVQVPMAVYSEKEIASLLHPQKEEDAITAHCEVVPTQPWKS